MGLSLGYVKQFLNDSGNFTTAEAIDIQQSDTEEAGVLAIWLKGVCLAVASQNPGDVHAALLGNSYQKGISSMKTE